MKKILETLIDKRPLIVLSVSSSKDSGLRDQNILQKIDIVEFRADLSNNFCDIEFLKNEIKEIKNIDISLLLTIRSPKEGGGGEKEDKLRLEKFIKLIALVDFVDIEISSELILKKIVNDYPEKLIIASFHDFKTTPSDIELEKVFAKGKSLGGDIIKVACQPQTDKDMQRLLNFCLSKSDENVAVIAMGELGAVSRVFFSSAGSLLTYTFSGASTAPGQIEVNRLTQLINEFYPLKKKLF